jgi:HAD superfamily phosphatase (TIGR01668 family)
VSLQKSSADRLPGRFLLSTGLISARDARLAIPDQLVTGVVDIDFEALARQGRTHYVFDVDNTLVPEGSLVPATGTVEYLARARRAGFLKGLCLLSNTIAGVRKQLRLQRIAEMYGIESFFGASFWLRKPHPVGYYWALDALGANREHTVMVGDQMFTDVLGGNMADMYTILVNPLAADHWTTRTIGRRHRERILLDAKGLTRPNGGLPYP